MSGARRDAHTRVLLATGSGHDPRTQQVERLMATALVARGVEVHVLRCDGILPACGACRAESFGNVAGFVEHGPGASRCTPCFGAVQQAMRQSGARLHRFSDYLHPADVAAAEDIAATLPAQEMSRFEYAGLPVGGFAMAAATAFFDRPHLGNPSLSRSPDDEGAERRYLAAAILTVTATARCLQGHEVDTIVSHHSTPLPQRLMLSVCRQQMRRIVGWWSAHRRDCIMLGERGLNVQLAAEPAAAWEHIPLSASMGRQLDACLESRSSGTGDWLARGRVSMQDADASLVRLGINSRRPLIGLAPSLHWEATTDDPDAPFATGRELVFATIDYFAHRPELQLLVRIHPHQGGVSRLAEALIAARYPVLPPNVTVVGGEDPVSTYAVMERCNAVVVSNSTLGLELAATGVPVIVAGDGWMGRKGFTMDAASPAAYVNLLNQLPLSARASSATVERARRCAYHFFFRHMLPLTHMSGESDHHMDIGGLPQEEQVSLDVVCDGILSGGSFLYPA